MLLKPDCIPCILKMSTSAISQLTSDEKIIRELLCQILEIPSLRGLCWDITSPEVIELVMEKIVEAMDDPDPFRSLKAQQNKRMMELEPYLKGLLNEASDPLYLAMKLAMLGNAIDLMISDTPVEAETAIQERLEAAQVPVERFLQFKDKLYESELVLYFGDNSGEVVTDKLLIEVIKEEKDLEVIFVVRSIAALNDATLNEAKMVGIDEITPVLENGIDGPLPGTIISRCSSEVRHLLQRADLVISKGGGNFDTLEEEKDSYNITFLLLSKCIPYYDYFQTELYQPILANFFRE